MPAQLEEAALQPLPFLSPKSLSAAPLPVTRAGLDQEARQGACVQLLSSPILWNSHRKHSENGARRGMDDKWEILLCQEWLEGGGTDGSVPSAAGSRYVHTSVLLFLSLWGLVGRRREKSESV